MTITCEYCNEDFTGEYEEVAMEFMLHSCHWGETED